mmetsp:Transcript_4502/g.4927  ORF Transcript_4502/g.4927 Transcript_4502/m.4927 type:complete len:84 (-) Transcript_4502:744-995(-)
MLPQTKRIAMTSIPIETRNVSDITPPRSKQKRGNRRKKKKEEEDNKVSQNLLHFKNHLIHQSTLNDALAIHEDMSDVAIISEE